ncbi:hypothetical protein ACKI2N_021350 [Cupriavidus sp. 30B13]|uniref:hypothetical protein n=1 Tax=Cupriavidus sp. 30B13 TaxID=3384241 RepID=UPI003B8EE697
MPRSLPPYRVLLELAGLSHAERQLFIALMNEFLLASRQGQRRLAAQWQDLLENAGAPWQERERGSGLAAKPRLPPS